MDSNLNDIFLKLPREKDGARTLSRYGFQIHASLSKILQLHSDGKSFRALFDHFDDLVIIEDPDGDCSIKSYQIKGKASGAWTAASLSKCDTKNDALTSVIGKMYQLTEIFENKLTSSHFLTNAHFSMKLNHDRKSTVDDELIEYANLHLDEKEKFSTTLSHNFPNPRAPSEDDIIVFEQTDVPVKSHEKTLKGELATVLSMDTPSTVTGIYNTLIADVFAKSKDTTSPTSTSDLFDLKSISSEQLQGVITEAEERTNILDCWNEVSTELMANGFSMTERIRLKSSVIKYLRDRSNGASSIRDLTNVISEIEASEQSNVEEITDLLQPALDMKAKLLLKLDASHEELFIHAACLVTVFEKLK